MKENPDESHVCVFPPDELGFASCAETWDTACDHGWMWSDPAGWMMRHDQKVCVGVC